MIGGTGAVSVTGTGGVLPRATAACGVYLDKRHLGNLLNRRKHHRHRHRRRLRRLGVERQQHSASSSGAGPRSRPGVAGLVTVTGTGGPGLRAIITTAFAVTGTGSTLTSAGGDVSVTGTGGGSGASTDNYGISVNSALKSRPGATGPVTMTGTGGVTTGNFDHGVFIYGANTLVTSGGGSVHITGTGGTGAGATSLGVVVDERGHPDRPVAWGPSRSLAPGGDRKRGINHGVFVRAQITSSGGDITLTGTPGGEPRSASGSSPAGR